MTAEHTGPGEPERRRFQFTLRQMLLVTLAAAIVLSWLATTGFWRRSGGRFLLQIDAKKAAKGAIAQYDTDGDALIGRKELTKAPALRAAIKNLDTDGDGNLAADEIAARIQSWLDSRAGKFSWMCSVTLDGKPLSGATVTFVPEKFLGKAVQPASGVTDSGGYADLSVLPNPGQPNIPGVYCGLYRVEISRKLGGKETIPPKYNTQTILGQEVANDAANIQEGIRFDLSSPAEGVEAWDDSSEVP
jgi:hypothetical protein